MNATQTQQVPTTTSGLIVATTQAPQGPATTGGIFMAATRAKQALQEARLELFGKQQAPEDENDQLDKLLLTAAEAVYSEAYQEKSQEVSEIQSGRLAEPPATTLSLSMEGEAVSEDSQQLWDMRWANMMQVLDDCIGDAAATVGTDTTGAAGRTGSPTKMEVIHDTSGEWEVVRDPPRESGVDSEATLYPEGSARLSVVTEDLLNTPNPAHRRQNAGEPMGTGSMSPWAQAAGAEAGKRLFRVAMTL